MGDDAQLDCRDPNLKWSIAGKLREMLGAKTDQTVLGDIADMLDIFWLPIHYVAKQRGFGYTEKVTEFLGMNLAVRRGSLIESVCPD